MKITICGSIAFYDEMQKTKELLEQIGHQVKLPPAEVPDENGNLISVSEYYKIRKEQVHGNDSWVWKNKKIAIKNHFKKIDWADAILVLNHKKNNITGYVGANTLMEMGLALYLDKTIYLLNDVPELSYKEELLGIKPIIIGNDLNKIFIT